ncbi:MAG TPA: hypothetical protein VMF55_05095 [Solirubrobacterales bacterium]|nr:hypothetical protein [Solirubrobacterales bacterium]
MTMTRTDKAVATALAFCVAIALACAGQARAAGPTGFKVAKFKVEIEGTQNSVWHRTVEAEVDCGTSDHSFGREKLAFRTTKPIYLTATHLPGEFNPQMFGSRQLGIPTTAKVRRSFTPAVVPPARVCEENDGGAPVTPPDCGTRTIRPWKLNLQYATDKKNALLLSSGDTDQDPYVNCPGSSLSSFPWLIVEGSGHKGDYIAAEVSQDELFDPKFQKWIAIGHGTAKESGSTWWSRTEITYSVSFTRLKK